MTRLVEAISKAIAEVKLAPLAKIDRARATAAYEQEEDAMPSRVARVNDFGLSSGSSFVICFFETTACMAPESRNPNINAQRISHPMAKEADNESIKVSMIPYYYASSF
jgi:hypothetical protein